MNPNLQAFLDTIATSELGARLLAESDNGYNVLVGSTPDHQLLFHSYADHPRILNHQLDSTAAGRYQILAHIFDFYKVKLSLPDFSWHSQDEIAIQLITECHAIDDAVAGRFDAACAKCASRWASLPGANYHQHENKLTDLEHDFTAAGGSINDGPATV